MNQVIIHPEELDDRQRVVLTGRRAAHLVQILGVQEGGSVQIGMLGGQRGRGNVCDVGAEWVTLHCVFDRPALAPTGITLLLALPRPKVVRRLFSPLAASGVEKVIFTNAAKVERVYFDTHWLQPARFTPLLLEGLEQSGETRLPQVQVAKRLKPLVEDDLSHWDGHKFMLHPAEDACPAVAVTLHGPVMVAIGPEGGWTDYEIDLFRMHGFTCVTLGERILRSDVAVHTMVGILHGLLEQERRHE